jgi:hypothetical protein
LSAVAIDFLHIKRGPSRFWSGREANAQVREEIPAHSSDGRMSIVYCDASKTKQKAADALHFRYDPMTKRLSRFFCAATSIGVPPGIQSVEGMKKAALHALSRRR